MLIPPSVRFLSSRPSTDGRVIVFGAPLDVSESFRSGACAAPERIRQVSDVLETYSPTLQRDLDDLDLADAGDLDLGGLPDASALELIEQTVSELCSRGLPIMLGGEHTATLSAFNAVAGRFSDLLLLHLDAHMDLRERYEGRDLGHASWLFHLASRWGFERVLQLGVRSGTREEYALASKLAWSSSSLHLPEHLLARIADRPCYLTIDIDVLDPAYAPGTGCPEPGGPNFSELLDVLYALRASRVVAVDVMEVLPAADHGDITSVAAAKLVREAALLFGMRA